MHTLGESIAEHLTVSLKLYQRAQGFRYLSFGLTAVVCTLLAQPVLAGFCLVWPWLLHGLLPRCSLVLKLTAHWGWRALLVPVHLIEALLVTGCFVAARFPLVPVLCSLLALLAAAIAQGGVVLFLAVFAVIGSTLVLLDSRLLLSGLQGMSLADLVSVLMVTLLMLALTHAGFGRALQIHKSRLRWRHQGQRYQALSDRLSRYVPQPLLQRLAQLDPSPVDPQWREPLTWQRCWLTLVVIDLEGFSQLLRSLSAEHSALVLNRFLSTVDKLATEHGASLARFTGDGALLVWGDPQLEPPAQQVQLACELCWQLPQRLQMAEQTCAGAGAPVQLRARAAVTSGYCTVGDWGLSRLDYTVIGASVNLAQRLQQHALPNGALLDEASAAVLANASDPQYSGRLGKVQSIKVKGFGWVRAVALVPGVSG